MRSARAAASVRLRVRLCRLSQWAVRLPREVCQWPSHYVDAALRRSQNRRPRVLAHHRPQHPPPVLQSLATGCSAVCLCDQLRCRWRRRRSCLYPSFESCVCYRRLRSKPPRPAAATRSATCCAGRIQREVWAPAWAEGGRGGWTLEQSRARNESRTPWCCHRLRLVLAYLALIPAFPFFLPATTTRCPAPSPSYLHATLQVQRLS
ncbi:hypothetical protein PENSPDRAFT_10203 [Peniophora sp. CONT]|nr:hypothetical protein PENSPDRAFT_10203 [Peniophora sp. CONT]